MVLVLYCIGIGINDSAHLASDAMYTIALLQFYVVCENRGLTRW